MSELAKLDTDGQLEIHQYLTSIKSKKSTVRVVSSIQSAVHNACSEDIISGVNGSAQLTHFGRPKWKSKLLALAKRFPKKNFGVFFCGPPVGQEMVIAACKEASKPKRDGGSKFVFYHENF